MIEDLRITNMTRRPKPRPNDQGGHDPNGAAAKAGLNRSILDAGWGTLDVNAARNILRAGLAQRDHPAK